MPALDPALAAGLAAAAPAVDLLRLWYGGVPWAVAAGSVREVVGTDRLQRNPRPLPGSPYGWLLGESEEVAVYLPAAGGPPPGGDRVRAVVVLRQAAGPCCGLAVEAAGEVRREAVSRLRPLPGAAAGRRWAFPRVVPWEDGAALEIAPDAVPFLGASALPAGAGPGDRRPGAAGTAPDAAPDATPDAAPAPLAGAPRLAALALAPGASSAGLFVFGLAAPAAARNVDFVLPAAQVVEALPAMAPLPVPGAPEPLLGLLAWRGEILPVVDLGRAIGWPAAPALLPGGAASAHGLVARAARSRQLLAFPVERMSGVRQGPFPQLEVFGARFPGSGRVLGAFADAGRLLAVPDLDAALAASPEVPDAADHGSGAAAGWR